MWSPRLYQPVLVAFKAQLLATTPHYVNLGEHRQQFAAFLTHVAITRPEGYTVEELRVAIGELPSDGLERSAQALSQAIEGASDQREEYWKNRIQPFWQAVWPKSRDLATPRIAESLIRMAIAAGSEFPAALAAVRDWLMPIDHPDYIVHLLNESDLCQRFPSDVLTLLDAIVLDQQWFAPRLGRSLRMLSDAAPPLARDPRYQRLVEFTRRRGGDI